MSLKKHVLLGLLLGLPFLWGHSQNSFNTAGGKAETTNGSANYSIGQLFYTSETNDGLTALHGVQVPYEIFETNSAIESPKIDLKLQAYPNPVADLLSLQVDLPEESIYTYQLISLSGSIIKQGSIRNEFTQIDLSSLPSSSYFLKITNEQTALKTYKIIKY